MYLVCLSSLYNNLSHLWWNWRFWSFNVQLRICCTRQEYRYSRPVIIKIEWTSFLMSFNIVLRSTRQAGRHVVVVAQHAKGRWSSCLFIIIIMTYYYLWWKFHMTLITSLACMHHVPHHECALWEETYYKIPISNWYPLSAVQSSLRVNCKKKFTFNSFISSLQAAWMICTNGFQKTSDKD